MRDRKIIELDGRTGEGGGQVVRVAVALSALTGTPVRIHHVRGNRGGGRGGGMWWDLAVVKSDDADKTTGLKAQHASSVFLLAEVTEAHITGCFVGSTDFTFIPTQGPAQLLSRKIVVDTGSAASTLLIFQAVLPFFLFAGDQNASPIKLIIKGGTNVSFSLSYEYLDQVVLPSLELIGVPRLNRKLIGRGWTHGTREVGELQVQLTPLAPCEALQVSSWPKASAPGNLSRIDISIVVPQNLRVPLTKALKLNLEDAFPGIESAVVVDDDSRHPARVYTLLVAHMSSGFRLGRDWLYDRSTKNKSAEQLATEIARKIVLDLRSEIRKGGCMDEYLQDQLVIFQALADGRSTVCNSAEDLNGTKERLERTEIPFGIGSLHTMTARWVVSQMLPGMKWFNKGTICEGIGWRCDSPAPLEREFGGLKIREPA
ncbi:MAG: hypothetical protein M1818_007710 [Claussenomyces sp. TS43310]|nr:MAG: hypothetical protein M1818_007710 [Claussenomyces sp. TS43310]